MFHMHMCTHAPVFTYMHTTTVKEENKSAFLGLDKMLDSVRTQPIQSENQSCEGQILKVLVHLRMEILSCPDLWIETSMTSFSDRLFFFPRQACHVNESSAESGVSKCSFSLCRVSGKYCVCLNHIIKPQKVETEYYQLCLIYFCFSKLLILKGKMGHTDVPPSSIQLSELP